MIRVRASILALVFFVVSLPSYSQTPPSSSEKKPIPKESIEQMEALQQVRDSIDDVKKLAGRIVRKKYSDCLKAFGAEKFCTCLKEKSPVGIDFQGYIHVVTSTKEELGYEKLTKEDKQLIDNTLNAREICVGESQ